VFRAAAAAGKRSDWQQRAEEKKRADKHLLMVAHVPLERIAASRTRR
jgi:hypothetical protein